ncbi:hypothetical protein JCM19237_251 [Photobacterium aphoticum]|uniref:Lipoprotein n=1 Tax=Photobacterium aphoticum TaxID=754436 RepID=A0A090QYC5_9GAMM|nr:hypothetical protein JCM19237_251 [Photobacterium aphoticum]
MKMYKRSIIAIVLSSALAACGGGGGDKVDTSAITFNVANAQSLALSNNAATKAAPVQMRAMPTSFAVLAAEPAPAPVSTEIDAAGYKIDLSGDMEEITPHQVQGMRVFGDEAFFSIYFDGQGTHYYVVQKDNSYIELPVNGMAIHQIESGKILFEDGSIYDPSTQAVTKLHSAFEKFNIQAVSGNFAVLADALASYPVTKLVNVETGVEWPIQACNGPRMVAVSSTNAIVDDCTPDKNLFNVATGERSDAQIDFINGEAEYMGDDNGALVVKEEPIPELGTWKWNLTHVDKDGNKQILISDELNTGGECSNCFNTTTQIHSTDDWIAIMGLDRVTVKNIQDGTVKQILMDIAPTSIDIAGDEIQYTGSIIDGHTNVSGTYNLLTDTDDRQNRNVRLDYITDFH